MQWAAKFNPVTYLMEAIRSPILESDVDWAVVGKGFLIVAVLGALMLWANVSAIRTYD
jgi:ABC-type polysaccharide/polyol phosphate export permease